MKKTACRPLAIAALIAALSSCAGDPVTPPDWAQKVQSVYSQAAYIAQRGEGKTRQDAELDAAGAVARYIESQITAEQSSRRVWTGGSESESRTETSTVVRSQTRLVALRYAEDPWRNPATDKWETVAYIEREEAWILYEPQAKKAAGAFLTLDAAAQNEAEPFTRALRYGAAAAYANGAEYGAVRGFAQVLHPQKAQACFAEADRAAAALPEKLYAARQNAPVFVDCPADYNRMIYQSAVTALGASGFAVEEKRDKASAFCVIQVEEGLQKQSNGFFYYPSLSGTISGRSEALFSFSVHAGRQSATNPDLAKQRAYTALAAALGQSFSGELNRKLALYEKQ